MTDPLVDTSVVPTILDREVTSVKNDAFGHQHFAAALRSLIETHSPPFSIGLLGQWGTGKSTIKELYRTDLQDDPARSKRIHPITFNAWRHGGSQDLKRALLRHVFLALGGDDHQLKQALFQQIEESSTKKVPLWDWTKEALISNLVPAFFFLILPVAVLIVLALVASRLGVTAQWPLAGTLTAALAAGTFLTQKLADIRVKTPAVFRPATTITFPSTSAEQYEQLLLEQLNTFRRSRLGSGYDRIVIFVDDLDRLSATEMVEGLDAVRLFLEIPREDLPEGLGMVFVISCDEDRVAEALARGRGQAGTDLPGSVSNRSDARRYLDRLFQFRLEIPRFPKLDMRRFAVSKLETDLKPLRQSLVDKGAPIDGIIDRLIHVGVYSPRNAIQLLNAFAQSWYVALRREWASEG